jgi:hypothetical protein
MEDKDDLYNPHANDSSSIGSIETPNDISTKLLLSNEMSDYFEVEEILEACLIKLLSSKEDTE